jgi:hypothetical protein
MRPKLQLRKAITFDPIVGSRTYIYSSFRKPFSFYYLWNPYAVKRRFCLTIPE